MIGIIFVTFFAAFALAATTGACVCHAALLLHGAEPPLTFAPPSATILPSNEEKLFPSNQDRDIMPLPNLNDGDPFPVGYLPSRFDVNTVPVQRINLPEVQNNLSNVAVILVKRNRENEVRFKYFGGGRSGENFAVETWSCSKIFAAMNAAGHLGDQCPAASSDSRKQKKAGLADFVKGKMSDSTPLADLVSIIVTYTVDYCRNFSSSTCYTSNDLGGWFSRLGNRTRATWLVSKWLGRAGESLGANYGQLPPTDLGFDARGGGGSCNIKPDSRSNGDFSNTLSALTMAELLKRIVLARELPPQQNLPGTDWSDSVHLLRGAARSVLFPGNVWGGMSADDGASSFVRTGLDMKEVERRSGGMFREYSKDGAGVSVIRNPGVETAEVTYNGYLSAPVKSGNLSAGVEYFVSARFSLPQNEKTHLPPTRELIDQAYASFRAGMTAVNKAIFEQRLF